MRYVPALDGLRAIAILVVLVFHAWHDILPGGFIGVDVFFVLSGYLITSIIRADIDRGSFSLRSFAARRARRLLPALFLVLTAFAIVSPILFADADLLMELLPAAAYVSNLTKYSLGLPEFNAHTWSLSVEMQFYLVWPLLMIGLCRLSPRWSVLLITAAWVAATVWRILSYQWIGSGYAYFSTETRFTALLAGAFVAMLPQIIVPRQSVMLVGFLVIGAAATTGHFYGFFDAAVMGPVVELGSALIVLSLVAGQGGAAARLLTSSVPRLIGRWSYGIYLWHYPIARLVRDDLSGPVSLTITLTASVVLAAASFELVERRFLATRSERTLDHASGRLATS